MRLYEKKLNGFRVRYRKTLRTKFSGRSEKKLFQKIHVKT
jgi:hypothetical protein